MVLTGFLDMAIAQTKNGFELSNTSIPIRDIMSGGPPKDGIPALTKPSMLAAKEASYLIPEDRVIGVALNGESRAYPIKILNYHEIVNDITGGTSTGKIS